MSFRIFPRKDGQMRSCKIKVPCGQAALISGYNLPEGVSICFNKQEVDNCACIDLEKEHCQLGHRAGITDESCEAAIVMPGCYVGIICVDPCSPAADTGLPENEEWGVYVDVCEAHANLQTLAQGAAVGA